MDNESCFKGTFTEGPELEPFTKSPVIERFRKIFDQIIELNKEYNFKEVLKLEKKLIELGYNPLEEILNLNISDENERMATLINYLKTGNIKLFKKKEEKETKKPNIDTKEILVIAALRNANLSESKLNQDLFDEPKANKAYYYTYFLKKIESFINNYERDNATLYFNTAFEVLYKGRKALENNAPLNFFKKNLDGDDNLETLLDDVSNESETTLEKDLLFGSCVFLYTLIYRYLNPCPNVKDYLESYDGPQASFERMLDDDDIEYNQLPDTIRQYYDAYLEGNPNNCPSFQNSQDDIQKISTNPPSFQNFQYDIQEIPTDRPAYPNWKEGFDDIYNPKEANFKKQQLRDFLDLICVAQNLNHGNVDKACDILSSLKFFFKNKNQNKYTRQDIIKFLNQKDVLKQTETLHKYINQWLLKLTPLSFEEIKNMQETPKSYLEQNKQFFTHYNQKAKIQYYPYN
jgi:hypothetical protein